MTQQQEESPYGTRLEHLQWCKDRALVYIGRGDLVNALASMISDMRKHPETRSPAVTELLSIEGVRCAVNGDAAGLRRLIEGFR